jgi:hypothetical protein
MQEPKPSDGIHNFQRSLRELQDKRHSTTDFLEKSSNFPVAAINTTFATVTRDCNFRVEPMHKESTPLGNSLNIFNFCPPNGNSAAYVAVVTTNNQILNEVANHEPDTSRTKTTSGLFIYGDQKSYDDLVTTIANFVLYLHWILKPGGTTPDILQDLTDIFATVTQTRFKDWFKTWSPNSPWLVHAILVEIQTMVAIRANFASSSMRVSELLAGNDINVSYLEEYNLYSNNLKGTLAKVMMQSTMQHFNNEPLSFKMLVPVSKKKQKTNDTNANRTNQRASTSTTDSQPSIADFGFLVIQGMPTTVCVLSSGKDLCLNWATVGRSCRFGRNCHNEHARNPLIGNNQADRTIITEWVQAEANVDWAPGIQQSRQTSNRPNTNGGRTTSNNNTRRARFTTTTTTNQQSSTTPNNAGNTNATTGTNNSA